jgi:hypothetical protein
MSVQHQGAAGGRGRLSSTVASFVHPSGTSMACSPPRGPPDTPRVVARPAAEWITQGDERFAADPYGQLPPAGARSNAGGRSSGRFGSMVARVREWRRAVEYDLATEADRVRPGVKVEVRGGVTGPPDPLVPGQHGRYSCASKVAEWPTFVCPDPAPMLGGGRPNPSADSRPKAGTAGTDSTRCVRRGWAGLRVRAGCGKHRPRAGQTPSRLNPPTCHRQAANATGSPPISACNRRSPRPGPGRWAAGLPQPPTRRPTRRRRKGLSVHSGQ